VAKVKRTALCADWSVALGGATGMLVRCPALVLAERSGNGCWFLSAEIRSGGRGTLAVPGSVGPAGNYCTHQRLCRFAEMVRERVSCRYRS